MRAAHVNDSHTPRVDALAVYSESLDPATGRLTYYYKIDLPEAIDATVDREFWYKWGWPLMHSEEDAIFKFLDWRQTSPAASFHCEFPTLINFEPSQESIHRSRPPFVGSEYPSELNRFRLYYGTETNIGHYIQHGWLTVVGNPPNTVESMSACNASGGWPNDFQWSVPAPTKYTVYLCPEGYKHLSGDPPHGCSLAQVEDTIEKRPLYNLAAKPLICPPKEGNPCNPATGGKTETETDFALANGTLKIQRFYNSQAPGDGYINLGPRWRHNYSQRMDGYDDQPYKYFPEIKSSNYETRGEACYQGWNELKAEIYGGLLSDAIAYYQYGTCEIRKGNKYVLKLPINNTRYQRKDVDTNYNIRSLTHANGTYVIFRYLSGQWQPLYPTKASLILSETNWTYVTANGHTENYDSSLKLLSTTNLESQTTQFSYDADGRLSTVTGHYGETLTYHYDESSHLVSITTPEGELNYVYDTQGRLSSVTYPDNRQRHYHYEDANHSLLLTGITDENGNRYASWTYDAQGKALSSEHANGTERVEFTYNPDGTTTVTDAAGAERTYHFEVKQGTMRVTHIEGDRCATCSNGGIKSYTYDSNGFIASKTDWNGHVTTYIRDTQGRELNRTEASGTPEARTVTITWDMTLNKPLIITEPERITEYTYDSDGRILTQQQRPHP